MTFWPMMPAEPNGESARKFKFVKYFGPSFLWSHIFQGYISDTLRYIFCAFFALKTDSMDNMRSSKYIFL